MFREALELVQQTAIESKSVDTHVKIVSIPGESNGVYGVLTVEGGLQRMTPLPPPRSHKLHSVGEVVSFLEKAPLGDGRKPVVYVSPDAVTIGIDHGELSRRLDRADVALRQTDEFKSLRSPEPMDQATFLKKVRRVFWDALGEAAIPLATTLKKLSFKTSETGHGTLETGRANYGRDIDSEVVSDAGDLAQFEQLTLSVRVFDDPALNVRRLVKCLLDVDAAGRQFSIIPLGNQLIDAFNDQLTGIQELIARDTEVPVFLGTP